MSKIETIALEVDDSGKAEDNLIVGSTQVFYAHKATDDTYGVVTLKQIDNKIDVKIQDHNINPNAHQDIRDSISELETRVEDNESDIEALNTKIEKNANDISNLDTRVTKNETDIAQLQDDVKNVPTKGELAGEIIIDGTIEEIASQKTLKFVIPSTQLNKGSALYEITLRGIILNLTDVDYFTIRNENDQIITLYVPGENTIFVSNNQPMSVLNRFKTFKDLNGWRFLAVTNAFTTTTSRVDGLVTTADNLTDYYTKTETYNKTEVDTKINDITSIKIRNVDQTAIEATASTVQTVATNYIVEKLGRQPQDYDGLFITMTDNDNDIVEWAYFGTGWVNVGLNGVDLSNYVDLTSEQDIEGTKRFNLLYTRGELAVNKGDLEQAIQNTQTEAQKMIILGADGVEETQVYSFTVQDADIYSQYKTNGTKFLVDLHLPVAGDLTTTKKVVITFGDTTYYVYNILKGSEAISIGDLHQVDKYNNATGYRFITEMIFFQTSDLTGFYIVPTVSMSDILALDSDEMDDYMADGGLTQGQLAICSKVINNGYVAGALYRFDITYPSTYTWTQLYGDNAQKSQLPQIITNQTVSTWVEDTTYTDFPYKATITVSGITSNDVAEVILSQEQASSGNYANVTNTTDGAVEIYSSVNTEITIPTIVIIKGGIA